MNEAKILQLTMQALWLALILSLPAVIVAAVVGLFVSFVQAITSLQEQSVLQGVKLIAVTVLLVFTSPWAASSIFQFGTNVFRIVFS